MTAPVYSVLHTFNQDLGEGINPSAGVTFGSDGSLYGTTHNGGADHVGTVWKINPAGAFSVLHDFEYIFQQDRNNNGRNPWAGVTIGSDGSLYGTAEGGVFYDRGTIWKIDPDGFFGGILHDFNGTNGMVPYAEVTIGSDGSLYGTTTYGGVFNVGTVWKLNPAGVHSVLHNFDRTNGSGPWAAVTIGSDGSLYGTTAKGGTNTVGTVWRINPAGAFSVLHHFDDTNGNLPTAAVTIGSDGSLYGTTHNGGTYGYGTVWKLNPAGAFSVLHHFDGTNDRYPYAGVTIGSDGSLYGTTEQGGTHGYGTIWMINPAGAFSVLHVFDRTNGSYPSAGVTLGSDGSLYGTTASGGSGDGGVVYRLTLPTSNVPGDVSGDGNVDCADIGLVKASFGKRRGQAGFNANADTNNDNVINIRDLVFVSRRLSSGLVCR